MKKTHSKTVYVIRNDNGYFVNSDTDGYAKDPSDTHFYTFKTRAKQDCVKHFGDKVLRATLSLTIESE
jgi:hypothetical protein